MSSSSDGDCLLRLALVIYCHPGNCLTWKKKLRPLAERMCVYKYIFKHVRKLFSEATKVRKWMKTSEKKLYSLDS